GEDDGYSSMGGGGTIGYNSLGREAEWEMISVLMRDSSTGVWGGEGLSSMGRGTDKVGSYVGKGFWARISLMEGIGDIWESS
ncbi:hypothetical protein KI387_041762, partial [Taxus chinensis]